MWSVVLATHGPCRPVHRQPGSTRSATWYPTSASSTSRHRSTSCACVRCIPASPWTRSSKPPASPWSSRMTCPDTHQLSFGLGPVADGADVLVAGPVDLGGHHDQVATSRPDHVEYFPVWHVRVDG